MSAFSPLAFSKQNFYRAYVNRVGVTDRLALSPECSLSETKAWLQRSPIVNAAASFFSCTHYLTQHIFPPKEMNLMPSNRSNGRDEDSRSDNTRNAGSRDDHSRANNDSLGSSSRSGRGGSWSHRDDEDRAPGRSRDGSQNARGARSNDDSNSYDRMEEGGSGTSAYGNEQSMSGDRYREDKGQRGARGNDSRSMSNRSNSDMGADSWGAASDRDTGRDRYNNESESSRDDYYGNRGINEDNYGSGRSGQMKGRGGNGMGSGRGMEQGSSGTGYGDRYSGREGGSNQFSGWQNGPSDMQSASQSRAERGSPWGPQSGMQSPSQFGAQPEMQRGQHAGRGPKGYRRDDNRITEDVNEALTRDHHIDASDIEVQVSNGEVSLSGTVDSREAKRHAEDLAEAVSGVNDVNNQIRVSRAGNSGAKSTSDSEKSHSMSGSPAQSPDKNGDPASTKSAGAGSDSDNAMSTGAGTGSTGAANASVSANNPSGKTSPNTAGTSTQKTSDKGSQS